MRLQRHFTTLILTLALLGAGLLMLQPLHAQEFDKQKANKTRPGSIFVSAFYVRSEADKLFEQKKYHQAWDKYHQALRYYQTLAANFPEWKAPLVQMRIERTNKRILEVTPLAKEDYFNKKKNYNSFVDSNTSENGIESPALAAANRNSDRRGQERADSFRQQLAEERKQHALEKKRLTLELKTYKTALDQAKKDQFTDETSATFYKAQIKQLRQELARAQQKRGTSPSTRAEVIRLNKRIGVLEDTLRKSSQGLLTESTQTAILNKQIRDLEQQVLASKQDSKKRQSELLELINQLTTARQQIAEAPLKKDVELLTQKKKQLELELDNVVRLYKRLKQKTSNINEERTELEQKLNFAQQQLAEKSTELEKITETNHKLVKTLRSQVKALDTQVKAQQTQIANLTSENTILRTQIANLEATNQELKSDLDAMTLERDKLSEMLNLSDLERSKKIYQEALRLGKELRKQQLINKQLDQDKNATQEELIVAKNNLVIAKKKLIDLQAENTNYIKHLGKLQDTFRTTKKLLEDKSANPNNSEMDQEEIIVLKETLRNLQTQLRRKQQAEQLLRQEYKKTALKDTTIGNIIEQIINNQVALTANEEQLLEERANTDSFVLKSHSSSPRQREIAKARSEAKIQALENTAKRAIEQGKLQYAKFLYDQAYDDHGYHYPFFVNRGVIRLQLGEIREAEEIFEAAAQLKDQNHYTHFMLGFCRYKLQKNSLAEKSLFRSLALRPDYTPAHIYLGSVAYANADYPRAIKHLEQAVQLEPENPEALFNLAFSYFRNDKRDMARKTYDRAIAAGLPPQPQLEELLKD